jgi:hypothetical protein
MLTESRVITSAVLARRDLPELAFPEHIWGSEDWALWLRLALRYPFAAVDELLVTMHQQGDNLTARKGRLYRNDVQVLEELLADPVLDAAERAAVEGQLPARRVGAVYHSLVRGETREARRLLRDVPPSDLGWAKYQVYRALSVCPGALLRAAARVREL